MEPTFKEGSILLGWCWFWFLRPKVGHVVIVRSSLKRIKKINSRGVYVEGDNKNHSSAHKLGYVQQKEIEAVIIMKIIGGK